jgi:methylglutaconyl-CoA hydratase
MGSLALDEALEEATGAIATRRASAEGQEGMRAFLERRSPSWADRSPS